MNDCMPIQRQSQLIAASSPGGSAGSDYYTLYHQASDGLMMTAHDIGGSLGAL